MTKRTYTEKNTSKADQVIPGFKFSSKLGYFRYIVETVIFQAK